MAVESILADMRIVLFGAGSGLRDLLSVLPAHVEVAGVIDNDAARHGQRVEGHLILSPADAARMSFDYLVITTRAGDTIRAELIAQGFAAERILVFYATYDESLRQLVNRDLQVLNRELGLGLHPVSLCTMQMWPEPAVHAEDDFCRVMAIQLAAARLEQRGISGAVAELGVYKGEMAAMLSRLLPSRRLYLFDTFEGFSANDLGSEAGHSQATAGDFSDTSVEQVLRRLAAPERVIVRKGYFPETAVGVEDEFALVSLDVDLYQPTLAGLRYFYPRLVRGGSIFVHDYNNRRFQGVRAAVEEFLVESSAPMTQLPDLAGSVVILK